MHLLKVVTALAAVAAAVPAPQGGGLGGLGALGLGPQQPMQQLFGGLNLPPPHQCSIRQLFQALIQFGVLGQGFNWQSGLGQFGLGQQDPVSQLLQQLGLGMQSPIQQFGQQFPGIGGFGGGGFGGGAPGGFGPGNGRIGKRQLGQQFPNPFTSLGMQPGNTVSGLMNRVNINSGNTINDFFGALGQNGLPGLGQQQLNPLGLRLGQPLPLLFSRLGVGMQGNLGNFFRQLPANFDGLPGKKRDAEPEPEADPQFGRQNLFGLGMPANAPFSQLLNRFGLGRQDPIQNLFQQLSGFNIPGMRPNLFNQFGFGPQDPISQFMQRLGLRQQSSIGQFFNGLGQPGLQIDGFPGKRDVDELE